MIRFVKGSFYLQIIIWRLIWGFSIHKIPNIKFLKLVEYMCSQLWIFWLNNNKFLPVLLNNLCLTKPRARSEACLLLFCDYNVLLEAWRHRSPTLIPGTHSEDLAHVCPGNYTHETKLTMANLVPSATGPNHRFTSHGASIIKRRHHLPTTPEDTTQICSVLGLFQAIVL